MNNTNRQLILEQLRQVENIIAKHADLMDVPIIEQEIILEKLRHIYEILTQIESNRKTPEAGDIRVEETKSKNHKIEHEKIKPDNVLLSDVVHEEKNKGKEEVISSSPNQSFEIEIESDALIKSRQETKILAEVYAQKDPLINEYLASRFKQVDLSSMLKNRPIKNLTEAIDINDKFLFTKELFHNNHELFQKTIEILNNMQSFNDAIKYLNQHYIWNFESETVQKFLEIIRRRYISDNE